ncbi:MAG: 4-(cytidine 5'-diphospho)-2-C-methyl-D-erythritol kinase [Cyclobacteriaceae bacterium]|nr:4-(cytidine 5'-diphospho)-2-C-methyl-D-erythritol kinase [Cyclobacteriaceae bacterium]
MIAFPHCKINLGLRVIEKRSDGFHNLETCFYPVPWTDILEITPAEVTSFHTTGIPIDGAPSTNLCMRAYQLLAQYVPIPPASIHLHKIIPMGAGLGGGSADAAFVLRALKEQFALNVPSSLLLECARQLGSDCAFFLQNAPMMGTGKGDILTPISLSLAGMYLVLVKPPVHVSTKEAYQYVKPSQQGPAVAEALSMPITQWSKDLRNDFEISVFRQHPELAAIKEKLYQAGAIYAAMSGSGSTLFGIFEAPAKSPLSFDGALIWQCTLPTISPSIPD